MKLSAQLLLLLALLSLLSLTFSAKVTVTKSFHTSVSVKAPSSGNGNGGGNGSGNEEEDLEEEPSGSQNEEAAGEEAEPEAEPEASPISPEFIACDPDNRPEICTLEYNPVCGYINECEGGACTKTFATGCEACSHSNVDGYVSGGTCKALKTRCNPKNRPTACPFTYFPTCAVASRCQGPFCFEDTSNDCVACSMKGVAYSLPGNCPANEVTSAERTSCDANNRPEICTADYTPVCAHISSCVGESCWFTAGNACSACGNSTVDSHIPGECPGESNNEEGNGGGENGGNEDDDRTFCDADNRPDTCTFDYTPVCAHIADCSGDDCWFTAGNACGACANATVDWHVPGECASSEDNDDRTFCDPDDRPEICTLDYTPVCAHISNCAGDNCWFTAGNACGACGNSTVDWHVPGECGVGDQRTYCDPDIRPEACTLEYNPVCAHTSGCTGDDCFNTAGNACGACGDATVDYWFPGECPNDVTDNSGGS